MFESNFIFFQPFLELQVFFFNLLSFVFAFVYLNNSMFVLVYLNSLFILVYMDSFFFFKLEFFDDYSLLELIVYSY
jgi:hypothetical protein